MDIISRFVNAGWNVNIEKRDNNLIYINVYSKNNTKTLTADGRDFKEAKQVLCLLNRAELPIIQQV
jgi:hypothetical protein